MATKKSAPKKATASRPAPKPAPGWNFETIQELIRMINKSELAEVEIEQQDFRLRVSRYASNNGKEVIYAQAPAAPMQQMAPQVSAPVAQPQISAPSTPTAPAAGNTLTFKSPMIGTFYKSSGPDKPAFVKVGDVVTKGQVLCIVEAMKLFNEIESDFDGRIVKIMVENATPVEYDQPLFLIEPNA